jgi:DNA-binding response OmpR family regulator
MKKKVVVVEDDPSIRDTLEIILTRAGFSVRHYSSAAEIFYREVDPPDIFLIDRQLSGVDGLEVCKHLRSLPSTASVPIIVLSATPGMLEIAKSAGADDFIEKPFAKAFLIQKIEEHTHKVPGKNL